jgi:nucleotide-binding universal stress UspA family protein
MKKVLLATDGSPFADDAAKFLAHLPHDEKLELYVLTVLDDPSVARGYAASVSMQELVEREKETARKAYESIETMFAGSNATLHSIVKEGHRGETIVEVAKQKDVDLIVVGARGHSMVSRLVLGSTSDFVATHAHCSVVVIRSTGFLTADRPLRIVVGYEQSGPAQAALEEFAEISWGRQTDVHLVTVVSYMTGLLNEVVPDPEPLLDAAREVVERAAKQLRSSAPNTVGDVVASEHAGEGLVRYAEEHQSDLLVVGETQRSPLGRFLLGSFSRYVLRHAPCSVWISRNRTIRGTKKANEVEAASSSS